MLHFAGQNTIPQLVNMAKKSKDTLFPNSIEARASKDKLMGAPFFFGAAMRKPAILEGTNYIPF